MPLILHINLRFVIIHQVTLLMKFLKKNWSNLVFIIFIALLIIPQTRTPIQVALNRIIAFSPSEVSEDDRKKIDSYNWNLLDLKQTHVNFMQSKGEVVILNLWATWCPPCIAEMPSFQHLYNDYGDKVDFYFVSSEESGKLRNFLNKHGYDLPVYMPQTMPPYHFRSNSLPTTFVISRTGEIVVNKTGAANWNDGNFRNLLDRLVAE